MSSMITMESLLEKAGLNISEMEIGVFYPVKEKGLKLRSFDHQTGERKFGLIEHLVFKGYADIWEVSSKEGLLLRCREDHRVYDPMKAEYVFIGQNPSGHLLLDDGAMVEYSAVNTRQQEPIVDMQIEGHNYFSNGVLSHNTVFHSFLGQQIDDPNSTKNFIRKVFENSKIPYLTISPVYSICPVHGYLPGSQDHCPKCRDEQVKAYKKKLSELRKKREELEVIG